MLEEITVLYDLVVYTEQGVYLGEVANIMLDREACEIESLVLEETNENLVEGGRAVSIPFRWVGAVGDIIILKHFPKRIEMTPEEREAWERQV